MRRLLTALSAIALAGSAAGQDSVAFSPGGNDALSPFDTSRSRYVIDLAQLTSSWGNGFAGGPLMKTHADGSGQFSTNLPLGCVISAESRFGDTFQVRSYAVWNSAGAGVNTTENATPGFIDVSSFDLGFAVGASEAGGGAGGLLGAIVGWEFGSPDRLFVERVSAATSRSAPGAQDSATLAIGAIDESGRLFARADAFRSGGASPALGDSILWVECAMRNASVNSLFSAGGMNDATDPGASGFAVNNAARTLATPSAISELRGAGGNGAPVMLDFAGEFRAGAGTPTSAHLAPGVVTHRGNPSYSSLNSLGDGGVVASLAKTTLNGPIDAINAFGVTSGGAPDQRVALPIPASIIDGAFTANAPEFIHAGSQLPFRGGAPVGVGRDLANPLVFAATARDDLGRDLVAVAKLAIAGNPGSAAWSLAARVGSPVLDGPGGQAIGAIADGAAVGSPVALSAPAVDLLGNVYFVASYKPNLAPARTALIKAVNSPGGYELEAVLEVGQVVVGPNSTRPYAVRALALGDADGLSSASFHAGSLHQPRRPGHGIDPALPDAFGGLVLCATLEYDDGTSTQTYDAVYFVGPLGVNELVGDLNGDNQVDASDLTILLALLGTDDALADLNEDGVVDSSDLSLLLANFGFGAAGGGRH